jgi:hypothetical protein
MDRREFAFLESLACFIEAKTIVEVGVQLGDMAIHLCRAAQQNGGRYFGFDIWQKHGVLRQYPQVGSKESVAQRLKENNLNVFELTQIDTINDKEYFESKLGEFCPDGIDFAFVDACHSYLGVANDFFSIYPRLTKSAVVAFHDTTRIDGCREFMIDLRTKYNDGTFDLIDFPYGFGERRSGVSILSKRSLPTLPLGIDEVCGSVSTSVDIEQREIDWYDKEIDNDVVMPKEFRGDIILDNLGFYTRNKLEQGPRNDG